MVASPHEHRAWRPCSGVTVDRPHHWQAAIVPTTLIRLGRDLVVPPRAPRSSSSHALHLLP
jgi:hypothetical protein